MGLFSKIADIGEDVGRGIFRKVAKPFIGLARAGILSKTGEERAIKALTGSTPGSADCDSCINPSGPLEH